MAQIEIIGDVMAKEARKTLLHFMRLVDPQRNYAFTDELIFAWNKLSLTEQRKLYLYLLYRKWQGEQFFGTPYNIVTKCHPYPTNWNGRPGVNCLMKSPTKMVIAKFDGYYGTFTLDEAKVWDMTDLKPLNF